MLRKIKIYWDRSGIRTNTKENISPNVSIWKQNVYTNIITFKLKLNNIQSFACRRTARILSRSEKWIEFWKNIMDLSEYIFYWLHRVDNHCQ